MPQPPDIGGSVAKANQSVLRGIDRRLGGLVASGDDPRPVLAETTAWLAPQPTGSSLLLSDISTAGKAPSYAKMILRTETTRALSNAKTSLAVRKGTFVQWQLAAGHPRLDPCDDRASDDDGFGSGVFLAGTRPNPPNHPNCLCYLVTVPAEKVEQLSGIPRQEVRQMARTWYDQWGDHAPKLPSKAELERLMQIRRDAGLFEPIPGYPHHGTPRRAYEIVSKGRGKGFTVNDIEGAHVGDLTNFGHGQWLAHSVADDTNLILDSQYDAVTWMRAKYWSSVEGALPRSAPAWNVERIHALYDDQGRARDVAFRLLNRTGDDVAHLHWTPEHGWGSVLKDTGLTLDHRRSLFDIAEASLNATTHPRNMSREDIRLLLRLRDEASLPAPTELPVAERGAVRALPADARPMDIAPGQLLTSRQLRDMAGIPKTHLDFYLREGIVQPSSRTTSGNLLFTQDELTNLQNVLATRAKRAISRDPIPGFTPGAGENYPLYDLKVTAPEFPGEQRWTVASGASGDEIGDVIQLAGDNKIWASAHDDTIPQQAFATTDDAAVYLLAKNNDLPYTLSHISSAGDDLNTVFFVHAKDGTEVGTIRFDPGAGWSGALPNGQVIYASPSSSMDDIASIVLADYGPAAKVPNPATIADEWTAAFKADDELYEISDKTGKWIGNVYEDEATGEFWLEPSGDIWFSPKKQPTLNDASNYLLDLTNDIWHAKKLGPDVDIKGPQAFVFRIADLPQGSLFKDAATAQWVAEVGQDIQHFSTQSEAMDWIWQQSDLLSTNNVPFPKMPAIDKPAWIKTANPSPSLVTISDDATGHALGYVLDKNGVTKVFVNGPGGAAVQAQFAAFDDALNWAWENEAAWKQALADVTAQPFPLAPPAAPLLKATQVELKTGLDYLGEDPLDLVDDLEHVISQTKGVNVIATQSASGHMIVLTDPDGHGIGWLDPIVTGEFHFTPANPARLVEKDLVNIGDVVDFLKNPTGTGLSPDDLLKLMQQGTKPKLKAGLDVPFPVAGPNHVIVTLQDADTNIVGHLTYDPAHVFTGGVNVHLTGHSGIVSTFDDLDEAKAFIEHVYQFDVPLDPKALAQAKVEVLAGFKSAPPPPPTIVMPTPKDYDVIKSPLGYTRVEFDGKVVGRVERTLAGKYEVTDLDDDMGGIYFGIQKGGWSINQKPTFDTETEAINYLMDALQNDGAAYRVRKGLVEQTDAPWVQQLTNDQKRAIARYGTTEFRNINGYLRSVLANAKRKTGPAGSGAGIAEAQKFLQRGRDVLRDVAHLDEALSKDPALPEAMGVWRGTTASEIAPANNPAVGKTSMDPGFLSTSMGTIGKFSDPIGKPINLHIDIPKGFPGHYIPSIANNYSEYEWLLPRNVVLKVLDVDPTWGPVGLTRAEVVDIISTKVSPSFLEDQIDLIKKALGYTPSSKFTAEARDATRRIIPVIRSSDEIAAIAEQKRAIEALGVETVKIGRSASSDVVKNVAEVMADLNAKGATLPNELHLSEPFWRKNRYVSAFDAPSSVTLDSRLSEGQALFSLGTSYAKGWAASQSATDVITHELVHAWHYALTRDSDGLWTRLHSWDDMGITIDRFAIFQDVGYYATENPVEFVAETFVTISRDGVGSVSDNTLRIYRDLHGPETTTMKRQITRRLNRLNKERP